MNAKQRMLQYLDLKGISQYNFSKETGLSNGFLKSGSSISSENMELISNIYLDLNLIWLITGKGDTIISEQLHTTSNPIHKCELEETRPRIPYSAAAGSLSVVMEGVNGNDCEQLPIIKAFARYDFTIFAFGDSMLPEYHSGDELACVYVRNTSFIQWGRVHVTDTAQGVLVKRIFDGGDSIICKSDNSDYPDFRIPKSEFYNVALVIGMIRRY